MTIPNGYPVRIKGTNFIGAIDTSFSTKEETYLVTIEQIYRADQLELLRNEETSQPLRLNAAHGDEAFRLIRSLHAWSNDRDNHTLRLKITESLEKLGLIKTGEALAHSAPTI